MPMLRIARPLSISWLSIFLGWTIASSTIHAAPPFSIDSFSIISVRIMPSAFVLNKKKYIDFVILVKLCRRHFFQPKRNIDFLFFWFSCKWIGCLRCYTLRKRIFLRFIWSKICVYVVYLLINSNKLGQKSGCFLINSYFHGDLCHKSGYSCANFTLHAEFCQNPAALKFLLHEKKIMIYFNVFYIEIKREDKIPFNAWRNYLPW